MFSRIILILFVCCISFTMIAQPPALPKPPAVPPVPSFPWPWKKKEKPSNYTPSPDRVRPVLAFVTDTAKIAYTVPGMELTGFADVEDTTYYFRHQPDGDTFLIYYDSSRSQLARKIIMVKRTRFNDTSLNSTLIKLETKTEKELHVMGKRVVARNVRYNDTSWYRSGALQKVETNIDELAWIYHNVKEEYSNGTKKSELRYTRDSCTYILWWPDSTLKITKRMANTGPWQTTFSTGEEIHWENINADHPEKGKYRCRKIVYTADSIIDSSFYYNGRPSRLSISYRDPTAENGMREHYRISYYSNGKKMHSPLYPDKKGRQAVSYYYVSGKTKSKGEWESGNVGWHYEYYEKNGKIKAEGAYTMTSSVIPHTQYRQYFQFKSGHWIYYDETGKTKTREEWYSGLTMEFVTYDKEGKAKKGEKQEVIPERILL